MFYGSVFGGVEREELSFGECAFGGGGPEITRRW